MSDRDKHSGSTTDAVVADFDLTAETQAASPAGLKETEAFLAIVNSLRGVPSSSHVRIVDAALVLLGSRSTDKASLPRTEIQGALVSNRGDESIFHDDEVAIPRRASIWLAQTKLSLTELDTVFHRGGSGVELIAHMVPGRSNRERVQACYLLAGIRAFLETGEARFSDDSARAMCRDLGCYDRANHATYIKALGNTVTGSKDSGFELTQPGLRVGAELIGAINALARAE